MLGPKTIRERGETPMAERTPTFGRYAEIPYDEMTPEQQEGYRSLLEARGRLPGPNKIYVHNPKLVKVMGPLGAYFRTGYSLSEREREIAVIIVNSKWHSIYPTNAHERAGKAAGLPADKVEALLSGLPTSFDDKREQVIYEMAKCLSESRWVSKGLYDRAVEALGHEGVTDVICLIAFYWRGDYQNVARFTPSPDGRDRSFAWARGEATLTRAGNEATLMLRERGKPELSVSLKRE